MSWQWLLYFWILITTIIILLRIYCKQLYRFWEKCNVPHRNHQFPLGDFQNGGFSKNMGVLLKEFYDEFPKERFVGIFMFFKPILLVKDPELIKTIFVKDFITFHDRGIYYNEKDDPLSAHLFAIEGLKWKNLRSKLTPTFTSGKMKMMFPIVVNCSKDFRDYLKEPAAKGEVIEIKEIVSRFMTDVIALCAFGIETNCLRNPKVMFRKMGKKSVEPNVRNIVKFMTQLLLPKFAEFIKMTVTQKDVSEFFLGAVRDVMEQREKQNIKRNDFMELLINLKNKGAVDDPSGRELEVGEKLTLEEAAAEAFVFYLAGFETSSGLVQYALYELAKNQKIQEKLRKEIKQSLEKNNGELTYEGVQSIPYLDQVIDETLRKYPVVPLLQRECNKNYKIPDSDAIIPKGTVVHIPVYGLHMDPEYYPDPDKFDPERFSEEEKQKRHNYTYLPFGEGPRNCIGKRFGQMQSRIALIVLLNNFRFDLSEELKKNPITFDQKAFVLLPKGGMNLKIQNL